MDESRTISKKAYDRLVFWLTMLITMAANVVVIVAIKVSGARIESGLQIGLVAGGTILYMALSRALAERILRRRGLTRRETVVEVHARSPFESDANLAPGETVEARLPMGMQLFLLIGTPLMALFMFFGAWSGFEGEVWMRWLCAGVGAFMTVSWVVGVLTFGQPQARVDADGVTALPSRRALWPRFVAWSDVFGCEVRTYYDTFGKPVLLLPILKGRHGETLMKMQLIYVPMIEQARIVEAIKARLPETEIEPWLM